MSRGPTTGTGVDAVCIGETMALLVPEPAVPPEQAETFRLHIGGAESNVAVHLARAGNRVTWHSAVGDDGFGHQVRERLGAEGVHCDVRTDTERPTGLYVKELGPDGTRVRYYRRGSAASTLGPDDAAAVLRNTPRLVHTTGITAALSLASGTLVEELLAADQPTTLRSFDVNYRPALHGGDHAASLRAAARNADVVFCGLDEAAALWGARTVAEVHDLLPEPWFLVVKQGDQGATAFCEGRSWHQRAPQVEVVEPVGAGDAFAAGVLHKLLSQAPVAECLAEGTRLAGTVLRVPGDIPPRPGGAVDDPDIRRHAAT